MQLPTANNGLSKGSVTIAVSRQPTGMDPPRGFKKSDIMNLISDRKYAIAMLILSIVYCISAFLLDADFNPVNEKYYPHDHIIHRAVHLALAAYGYMA